MRALRRCCFCCTTRTTSDVASSTEDDEDDEASDSPNDGNPYRVELRIAPLSDAHAGQRVTVTFDECSRSDSLEDDEYYECYTNGTAMWTTRGEGDDAAQLVVMLSTARGEANACLDADGGGATQERMDAMALAYDKAIAVSAGSLRRKLIREYEQVRCRYAADPEHEQLVASKLAIARNFQYTDDERRGAYRYAIRMCSAMARKKDLKVEYNQHLVLRRIDQSFERL